jgi:transcriptional regulator with XRE-family HTH domain
MKQPPPAAVLRDYLAATKLTPTEFARYCAIERSTLSQLLHGKRGVTGTVALRILAGTRRMRSIGLARHPPISVGALIPEFAGVT